MKPKEVDKKLVTAKEGTKLFGLVYNNMAGMASSIHIFGSCMHPDMSKHYIARHDKAMRTVIQAFTKGQCGSHYLIADIGKLRDSKTSACTVKEFQPLCSQTDVHQQGAWTLRWRGVSCRGEQQTHAARIFSQARYKLLAKG